MAVLAEREVALAPARDVVEFAGIGDGLPLGRLAKDEVVNLDCQ
jgi:hypothetical protein